MRLIGHLDSEPNAKTFGDYLTSVNIRNQIDPDAGRWAVWIYSEDQIDAGREALAGYMADPSNVKYKNVARTAAAVAEKERLETERFAKRYRTADQVWVSATNGPLTLVLIALSVIVTLPNLIDSTERYVRFYLSISAFPFGVLPEIRHGEIWRLITPIFIHMSVLHIIFNMMMMRTFGSLIENRQGAVSLLILVIVIGIGSNLGQYFYNGPYFGGMSGVLYGLFGYVWMRGKFDVASHYYVPSGTVTAMLVWFVLCLFGVIGNVANACHLYGLAIGMVIGVLPVLKRYY
jgi:GlpG protein